MKWIFHKDILLILFLSGDTFKTINVLDSTVKRLLKGKFVFECLRVKVEKELLLP